MNGATLSLILLVDITVDVLIMTRMLADHSSIRHALKLLYPGRPQAIAYGLSGMDFWLKV